VATVCDSDHCYLNDSDQRLMVAFSYYWVALLLVTVILRFGCGCMLTSCVVPYRCSKGYNLPLTTKGNTMTMDTTKYTSAIVAVQTAPNQFTTMYCAFWATPAELGQWLRFVCNTHERALAIVGKGDQHMRERYKVMPMPQELWRPAQQLNREGLCREVSNMEADYVYVCNAQGVWYTYTDPKGPGYTEQLCSGRITQHML